MKRIAVNTLGCKVNQYDTEAMLEQFERAGYVSVPFDGEADVYLINTCTVTGVGDQKSMKLIRRVAREHPAADIIVAGCLSQRGAIGAAGATGATGAAGGADVALPGVRLILGNRRRAEAYELYAKAVAENSVVNAVGDLREAPFERLRVDRHEGKTRAVMKIQEGCDRRCAYCVIPSVRGPARSMALEDVASEARRLAEAGHLEIVLTGIHLSSYGREFGATLVQAIEAVNAVEGVRRVRIGSLEPMIAADEFVRALRRCEKLCPQFHLSLQSGSDAVLKRMNRGYSTAMYLEAVSRLREGFPGCALTTDILTGFPGETDGEAAETLAFVERVGFSRIHVFPYSRRAGTAADQMPNQVPQEVKRKRAAKLTELGNKMALQYAQNMVGTVQAVLFEEAGTEGIEGYTSQYVRARVTNGARPGELLPVTIDGVDGEGTALGCIAE